MSLLGLWYRVGVQVRVRVRVRDAQGTKGWGTKMLEAENSIF